MKKAKKFLSVILAVLMAFSSMAVGFVALAEEVAEGGETAEATAVDEAEKAITDFYANRYHTLMFSEKEEEAEKKAEALKAFDEICAKIKALSEVEKLDLELSNYAFILGVAADKVGRDAGQTSTNAKVYGASAEGFKAVEDKMGALPADYQKALEFAQSLYVKVNNTLFNSSFDFKTKADGYAHYESNVEAIKNLTPAGVSFAEYFYPNGSGFYFYCITPTAKETYLSSNIAGITYNYYQDKDTSTGKDPSSVGYSAYIDHKRVNGEYVNTWKAGKTAVDYKTAFDNYFALTETDVVSPAKSAYEKVVELFSAVYGNEFNAAAMAAYETGLKNYNTGEITVVEINDALAKIDAVTGSAASVLNTIMSATKFKVSAKIIYPAGIEFTAETSADDVYNNQIKVETKNVSQLIQGLKDVLTQLQVKEFEDTVMAVDLDKLDEETVENVRALYVAIPSNFRNTISADAFAKFTKIIMPTVDKNDFSKEIADFKTIPVNRADIGGDIIWTEEGVQKSVDGTYKLVKSILGLAKIEINGKQLDLTNGLNDLLKDNLYQVTIVEALFDLYATLSHNETETGVSLAPTLGKVIQLLISPSTIKGCFAQPDNKYAAVIEKLNAVTLTDEEKAEGINEYDKFAAIEFTAEDFGFVNGDKDGFIDALLAVLRPITYLLSGDNGILGVAGVKIAMFDSVDSAGVYHEGIYSMLLPLLEQIGLTDLPTAAEYKVNYDAQRAVHKNLGYDEILRPVIDSLFKNVVQPVADDPLNGVIDILPRIAHVINTNMVDDTVKTVITSTGDTLAGLAGGLDLSKRAINNMISGVVINIDENTSIRLKPINWHILADCSTVEAVPSHTNANEYVMLRTGDADSCWSQVYFYVYELLFADADTYAAVKALLSKAVNDPIVVNTVTKITDNLVGGGRNKSFNYFLALTAGEPGETPIPRTKADAQNRFTDLAGFEFYDDYVGYTSVYNSFITGTNPPKRTMFSPTASITRAMFITILYRMAGEPYKNANPYAKTPFTDITDTSVYYYDAACWALDNGITNQTRFRANDNVNRQETASFLFRYAQANDMILNENYKETDLSAYSDYKAISGWAAEAMQWANYNGMITGTMQGTANPLGATQRIHATKILYGFGKNCDIGNFA